MNFTWTIRWEDPRHGENPRVTILAADNDHDAAKRCLVFVNVVSRAICNAG